MKKTSLLVAAAAFLLGGCTGPGIESKTDWEMSNIKGKVKSTTETSYDASLENGVLTKGARKSSGNATMIFDEDGHLIEHITHNANGAELSRITVTYDGSTPLDGAFYKNGWFDKKRRFETADGKTVATEDFDGNGNKSSYATYKRKCRRLIIKEYDMEGNRKTITKYRYDKNSNVIRTDYKGESEYTMRCEYDGDKQVSMIYLLDDGDRSRRISFDENGFISKIDHMDSAGKISKEEAYEYELDETGNWIVQNVFDGEGNPISITERSIEYF